MKRRGYAKELNLKDLKLQIIVGIVLVLLILVTGFVFLSNQIQNSCIHNDYSYDRGLFSLGISLMPPKEVPKSNSYPLPFPVLDPTRPPLRPTNKIVKTTIPCESDSDCLNVDSETFGNNPPIYRGCEYCDTKDHLCTKSSNLLCDYIPYSICDGQKLVQWDQESICNENFFCVRDNYIVTSKPRITNCNTFGLFSCNLHLCTISNNNVGNCVETKAYDSSRTGKACELIINGESFFGVCKLGKGCVLETRIDTPEEGNIEAKAP